MTTTTEALASDAAAARSAAIAWHRRQHERVCDRVEPWEHGIAVRATAHPTYWDYNLVVLDGDGSGATAEALAAVAEAHHGDLAHRQVQVLSEAAGERLRPGFEALGFHASTLKFMALAGSLPTAAD